VPLPPLRPGTKCVLEGIGVTTLVSLLALYTPVVGIFFALFVPLPVLFYRSRLGRQYAALITAATLGIVMALSGASNTGVGTFLFVELLLLGFVLEEFMEKNLSVEKTVTYTAGAVLAAGVLFLAGYTVVSSTDIHTQLTLYLTQNLNFVMEFYRDVGVSADQVVILSNAMDRIVYVLVRMVPSVLIVSTLFVVWTNLLAVRPFLESRKLFYPDFGPLNRWRAPERLVWGVIGSGVLVLAPFDTLKFVGLNALVVLMVVYFFQGIGIVSHFMERKGFPRQFRILVYAIVGLQQALLLVVVALGLFDLWVDFRRLNKKA